MVISYHQQVPVVLSSTEVRLDCLADSDLTNPVLISFHSIIAFRKANKVGIFIKVTPQREEGEVTVCFKMKHDFKNLAAPIRPIEESDQGTEVIWLTQHVELSLGPLLP